MGSNDFISGDVFETNAFLSAGNGLSGVGEKIGDYYYLAGGGGGGSGGGGGGDSEIDDAEHPLTAQKDSKWAEWHADEELRAEIKKDVDRTLPDYSFYNRELPMGRLHAEAISRILFVYAKLNPGSSAAR